MCGIVGFIGFPKNPAASFDLTTSLLVKTQTRGDDASGYWATETGEGDDVPIYFSKEPTKSSEYVKSDIWKAWQGKKIDLLISHCRASTKKGSENINKNNHPFMTADRRTALVHNGSIPEFDTLKLSYNVSTECDSEILLRIMEQGALYDLDFMKKKIGDIYLDKEKTKLIKDISKDEVPPIWTYRLLGLIDVWERVNYGAMATAIAERWEDGTKALWLFRNKERPLHFIDATRSLGQYFVVSDRKIFRDAVEETPSVRNLIRGGNTLLAEFPEDSIWLLMLSPNGEFSFKKFTLSKTKIFDTTFEKQRPPLLTESPVIRTQIKKVITNINHVTHDVHGIVSYNGECPSKIEENLKNEEQDDDLKEIVKKKQVSAKTIKEYSRTTDSQSPLVIDLQEQEGIFDLTNPDIDSKLQDDDTSEIYRTHLELNKISYNIATEKDLKMFTDSVENIKEKLNKIESGMVELVKTGVLSEAEIQIATQNMNKILSTLDDFYEKVTSVPIL